MKLIKAERLNLIAAIVLLWGMIFIRDVFSIEIPFIAFSVATLLCAVFLKDRDNIKIICALLPFCRGIPYSEIILIMLGVSFLKNLKDFKFNPLYYLPIILIGIIEIMDYFMFNITGNEIVYLSTYMLYTTYIVEQRKYRGNEVASIIIYSFATVLSVVSVAIREIKQFGLEYFIEFNARFGANTEGIVATNYNANELGLHCCVAAALMLLLYSKSKKARYIFLAIAASILGFLSVSRSFLIIIAVTWLFYLIYEKKNFKQIITISGAVVAISLIINLCFPQIKEWIVNYYRERVENVTEDGFGGRSSIFVDFWIHTLSSVWATLFGYSEYYGSVLNMGGAHNGIQEIIVSWGFVGLIIAAAWVFALVKRIAQDNMKKSFKDYTPFIIFFIFVQTIQWFSMHNYLIIMLVAIMGIVIKDDNGNNQVQEGANNG